MEQIMLISKKFTMLWGQSHVTVKPQHCHIQSLLYSFDVTALWIYVYQHYLS